MTNYDFKALNDKEFEALAAELLSLFIGQDFERFKSGKDGGVDGRFFDINNMEVVLQCKHWANTPISKLINELRRTEKPKLKVLNPSRYILAISNPVSRTDKKRILEALSPYVIREDDVYGREDLNRLLQRFPQVEKNHYKLWLHSTHVLSLIANSGIMGRSESSLNEILLRSARYAVTRSHVEAEDRLDEYGVLIISGDPGVGKTTLAEHLCLQYVAEGFDYVCVSDDIKEAESVFSKDSRQIFYFDDFLGRNYLEALRGHEGTHLATFIRRISRNKLKRFILTSRSTILNQGKFLIDAFEHDNLKRNEFELRIDSLQPIDKGRILYNHIWHSCLPDEFRNEFYVDRRYRKVIAHPNFNPRIINYITDPSRRQSNVAAEYWPYVERSLDDPSQIWGHPFEVQLDRAQRAIVLLVVLQGRLVDEATLADAYHRFLLRPENRNCMTPQDFPAYARMLTGSFLTRFVRNSGQVAFDIFNPSIGDFLLKKYRGDKSALLGGVLSLRSRYAVETLSNMLQGGLVSKRIADEVCHQAMAEGVSTSFIGYPADYISSLCWSLVDSEEFNDDISAGLNFIVDKGVLDTSGPILSLLRIGVGRKLICAEKVLEYLHKNLDEISSDDDISTTFDILAAIPISAVGHRPLASELHRYVVDMVRESPGDFVELSDAFNGLSTEDEAQAQENIVELLQQKFCDYGLKVTDADIESILESIDVKNDLYNHVVNSHEDRDRESSASLQSGPDEIDDLFDRS